MNGPHPAIDDFISAGRYDRAEPLIRDALAQNPHDASMLTLLAWCCLHTDRIDGAGELVREALEKNPDYAFAHVVLGRTIVDNPRSYVRQGTFIKEYATRRSVYLRAEPHYREALRLASDDPYYHAVYAEALLNAGYPKKAQAVIEDGLKFNPNDGMCLNVLSRIVLQRGGAQRAERVTLAALAANPDDNFTHANRGWMLLHAGRNREALEHLRESLRLHPHSPWAQAGLREALKRRFRPYGIPARFLAWLAAIDENNRRHAMFMVGAWLAGVVPVLAMFLIIKPEGWTSRDRSADLLPLSLIAIFAGLPTLFVGMLLPIMARWAQDFAGIVLLFTPDGRLALTASQRARFWAMLMLSVLAGATIAATWLFDAIELILAGLFAVPFAVMAGARLAESWRAWSGVARIQIGVSVGLGTVGLLMLATNTEIEQLLTFHLFATVAACILFWKRLEKDFETV